MHLITQDRKKCLIREGKAWGRDWGQGRGVGSEVVVLPLSAEFRQERLLLIP